MSKKRGPFFEQSGLAASSDDKNNEATERSEGASPILDKGGRNVARSRKSRVKGIAQKCKCGSVWCLQCFPQKHAQAHMDQLSGFKWDRTREVVLTVDQSKFESGQEAYEYVTGHRAIANLIRNIERGKKVQTESGKWVWLYPPIKITNWKWFLEWHKGGFPHWHLFIETEKEGKAGMIGGDRIRHYWGPGLWVYETYIKSVKHFRRLAGYFRGRGYFEVKGKHAKLTGHQVRLPEWAQEKYGSARKIRRSGSKCKRQEASPIEYFDRIAKGTEVIDVRTGEILRTGNRRANVSRSYKAILKSCGLKTRVKILSENSYAILLVDIPYKKLKKEIPGEYEETQGYAFRIDRKTIDWMLDNVLQIEVLRSSVNEREFLKRALDRWHEIWAERGYWDYMRHYG